MYTENKEKEAFRQLAEIVTEDTTDATIEETIKKPNILKVSDFDNEVQAEQTVYCTTYYEPHSISELISMNSECFGWINISGTNINYPVMHTPSNPQKYLNKNFNGEYSFSGTPFMDSRCSADSTNLVIYGHHMNNGSMFADLEKFKDEDFWREHKTIAFNTLTEKNEYEILAVFKTVVYTDSPEAFKYYRFTDAQSPEEFEVYIDFVKIS